LPSTDSLIYLIAPNNTEYKVEALAESGDVCYTKQHLAPQNHVPADFKCSLNCKRQRYFASSSGFGVRFWLEGEGESRRRWVTEAARVGKGT